MLIKFNVLIDRAADKQRAAQQNLVVSSCNTRKKADGEVLRLSVTAGGKTLSEAGM